MNAFEQSFIAELVKVAEGDQPRSSNMGNILKLLALGGLGAAGYAGYKGLKNYQAEQLMQQQLAEAQAAQSARNKKLLIGGALGAAGIGTALGLSPDLLQKVKGLFGSGAPAAAAAAPAAAAAAPAAAEAFVDPRAKALASVVNPFRDFLFNPKIKDLINRGLTGKMHLKPEALVRDADGILTGKESGKTFFPQIADRKPQVVGDAFKGFSIKPGVKGYLYSNPDRQATALDRFVNENPEAGLLGTKGMQESAEAQKTLTERLAKMLGFPRSMGRNWLR